MWTLFGFGFKQTKGETKERDNQRYLNTAWKFDNIKEMLVYLRCDNILVILKDFFIFLQYILNHVCIKLYDDLDFWICLEII